MSRLYCLCEANSYNKMHVVSPRRIDQSLPAEDILFLQDIFLTSGVHQIVVEDVRAGRKIVGKMLQSMNYYHEVACLTDIVEPPLKKSVINMYNSLAHYCGDDDSYDEVEEFFLEQYFADFMWIELSKGLLQIPIIENAMHALYDLDIIKHIPIVAISYNTYS